MSNPIPSQLALTTISNGTLADASPVESNFAEIQAAANELIAALSNGTTGQFLKAVDGSDVAWGSAADLSSSALQSFTGPITAKQLGFASGTNVAATGGTLAMSSGIVNINSYDGSFLTTITGHNSLGTILIIRNSTSQGVVFGTGGGTSDAIADTFIIPIGGYALLFYDTTQSLWVCLALSGLSNPYRQLKNPITYGTTVTPNAAFGEFHTVAITNSTPFTIANPLNPPGTGEAQRLTLMLRNTTASTSGTISFGSAWYNASPFTVAAGAIATIHNVWDGDSSQWVGV